MSDDRTSVYFDSDLDAWVYRISAIGECVRALVAMGLEYESVRSEKITSLLNRTAAEGDLHELAMRAALEEEGHVFEDLGDQIEVLVPIVKGKVYLRGHLDGRIISGPRVTRPSIVEFKSLSTAQFDKWMAKKGNQPARFESNARKAYQISGYMMAYPEDDVLYQSKRRDDGTVDTFIIEAGHPPISAKDIRKKVLTAESFRRQGNLPTCDIPNGWGCDFWYLHEETVESTDNLDEEKVLAVTVLAEEYDQYRNLETAGKEAGEKKRDVGKELVTMVGDRPFIDTGDWKVSVVSYNSSTTDWKAVEAEATDEMRDLIARHTTARPVTYPKVTRKDK